MKRLMTAMAGVTAVSILCGAAAFGQTAATKPAAEGKVDVKVGGLSVAMPDPAQKFGGSMAVGLQPGTAVAVVVTSPDKFFISVKEDGSKLESFADDKGKDLSGGRGSFGELSFPNISEDRHTVKVGFQSDKLPTAGARELKLKGALALRCGTDEKSAEQKDVELKKGATISAGPFKAEIKKVEPDKSGGANGTSVVFSGKGDLSSMKKLAFIGPDGKEIESHCTSWWRTGMDSFEEQYSLKGQAEKVTIVVTYFDKTESIKVPIDLTVTLGL